eukprot:Skav202052  [mRNA]  locus=scaffold1138:491578:493716:- [translate_table: standard]
MRGGVRVSDEKLQRDDGIFSKIFEEGLDVICRQVEAAQIPPASTGAEGCASINGLVIPGSQWVTCDWYRCALEDQLVVVPRALPCHKTRRRASWPGAGRVAQVPPAELSALASPSDPVGGRNSLEAGRQDDEAIRPVGHGLSDATDATPLGQLKSAATDCHGHAQEQEKICLENGPAYEYNADAWFAIFQWIDVG